VAGPATLLAQDLMDDLLFELLPGVTLVAEFASLLVEQLACLRSVGVMALRASPPLQHGMDIGLVHPDSLRGVALKADLIAFFFQKKLGNDPVPQMASFAFFLLDYRVYILHREVLIRKLLVAVETILLSEAHFSHGRPAPE